MRACLLVLVSAAASYAAGETCTLVNDMIVGTSQIDQTIATSAGDCCNQCNANPSCIAFTFDTASHQCFIKDNYEGNYTESNRISGTNGREPLWNACTGDFASFKFCDTSLSLDDRLDDLVARVNLSDIGTQLTARQSPAMHDIGVPAYYWGTNAIHGVQNVQCLSDGQCPTSFPAPCALSASFNFSLVHDMGAIIGREERAYYNAKVHDSIDTWSPTINLNRDPRWGRNVESPGEDPYANGQYGEAYTVGLQDGVDKDVVQSVVTLKHWIAYSVEDYDGQTRYEYDAIVSEYDLSSSYFPAFENTIRNGGALGVMCSYNSLNGIPTCANANLQSVLRDQWGFKGYITSDTDSIQCITANHHYEKTYPEAVRDGLQAGCDINSGNTYADNLMTAVNTGLLNVSYARDALHRSYAMRFRLGLFDPNVPNPYRSIGTDVVGSSAHQAVSLMASRKAMVLLKNSNNVLPFAPGKSIAVLGTSSNSTEDLLGNYNGPICPDGKYDCYPTIYQQIKAMNKDGDVSLVDDVSQISAGVAAAKAADFVVLVASNAADGGGEGHDRYNISLAADQLAFANAVIETGKPLVLVLINGGIIAIDDLKDSAPSILEAFMPGVHGAQAISETIFGLNNPGGKMPVTMYHSNYINEIPFLTMSMTMAPGRSYRYYTGEPLYPYGYGLSYTTFELSWSPEPPQAVLSSVDSAVTYTVNVTNTGKIAGDEVVMAFYKPDASTLRTLAEGTPVVKKQLFDFTRITLAAGESQTLTFTAPASKFALVDKDGHRSIHPGEFDVIFSRGHGEELQSRLSIDLPEPHREFTFSKWW